jgi:glutamine synthetase
VSKDAKDALSEAREKLRSEGVRFVQVEVPELDGGLRGKLVSLDKGLGDGIGFSNILYGLATNDDIYVSPFACYENGFADIFGRPHADTIRRLSWRPDTVAGMVDIHDPDGTMSPECPRTVLRRAIAKAAGLGFEPRIAVEYECYIYYTDDTVATPSPESLTPVSRGRNAYSLVRLPALRAIFETFMRRMEEVGAPIDSTHTELGHGAIEFALSHAPPLEAADGATRAKTYLKELCAERGMVATFMAKLDLAQPSCGAHVHQSLWRNGESAFWDGEGPSDVAKQYAAGQMEHLPALSALCMPTINSYRRWGWEHWVPENASWGHDNRTAALRLITHPAPKGVRFENRLPGADTNAYLTIGGMLAAGLDGVERGLDPPPLGTGNIALDEQYTRLPNSLEGAIEAFRSSKFLRRVFDDRFVDHYALSRQVELDSWRAWQSSHISTWEFDRYFETI